ncbi:MAG TPA: hypothetical protein VFN67_04050 [Polyangiales bacterium]|nr:hypothetical protein [Polyangiales bacterium]
MVAPTLDHTLARSIPEPDRAHHTAGHVAVVGRVETGAIGAGGEIEELTIDRPSALEPALSP